MTLSPPSDDIESVQAFGQSAQDLLRAESPLSRVRDWRVRSPRFDRQVWRRMAQAGWSAILAPESAGGLGLDLRHACAVAERVGGQPVPEPFVALAVQACHRVGHASAVRGETWLVEPAHPEQVVAGKSAACLVGHDFLPALPDRHSRSSAGSRRDRGDAEETLAGRDQFASGQTLSAPPRAPPETQRSNRRMRCAAPMVNCITQAVLSRFS
jgi:hypothetical protein